MGTTDGAAAIGDASLVVSVLALLVAAITALTQNRQGRRLALIEIDRRRDERQPLFDLDYDDRPPPLLRFTNHGPVDLADVWSTTVQKPPVVAGYRFPNQSGCARGLPRPGRPWRSADDLDQQERSGAWRTIDAEGDVSGRRR